MVLLFDTKGVTDYLPETDTVADAYYANELHKLCEALKSKHLEKPQCGVLLLHDNVPTHTSGVASSAAAECSYGQDSRRRQTPPGC